jgi:hypothetical protein
MTTQLHDPNAQLLQQVIAGQVPPTDEKAAIERCLQTRPDLAVPLLFTMLDQKHRLQKLLDETTRTLAEPPWHSATFLRLSSRSHRALVASGSRRLSVAVGPDVDQAALRSGQPVFLNGTQNVLVDVAPCDIRPGTVAEFARLHGANQGVVRGQADDELVVDLGAGILESGVQRGDLVLYDRDTLVAFD